MSIVHISHGIALHSTRGRARRGALAQDRIGEKIARRWQRSRPSSVLAPIAKRPTRSPPSRSRARHSRRHPMATKTPDDQRWIELARIIESVGRQVQALADAGGSETERVGGLEQTNRSIQEAVQNLAQRHGAGAKAPPDHFGSDARVDKNMVPEGLTNTAGFK